MKLFAASLADMHTYSLLDELRILELDGQASSSELKNDRYANESRREFLKYLFHEVRTTPPLLDYGTRTFD